MPPHRSRRAELLAGHVELAGIETQYGVSGEILYLVKLIFEIAAGTEGLDARELWIDYYQRRFSDAPWVIIVASADEFTELRPGHECAYSDVGRNESFSCVVDEP